ncbi:natural cytotoxicity triggering receptor 1 isoform 1-T2 [Molossus nigricans]
MPSPLTALLCLGLCLSQRVSAQKQSLSKPVIWAKPNFMIPNGMPVMIWCQGTRTAVEYQLYFEKQLSDWKKPDLPGQMSKVNFFIQTMSLQTAGQYRCLYRTEDHWSEPSDPLELVVTGMYDTPTLRIHPGPEVIPGENVTFYCNLETATKTFFLLKEGPSNHPQHRSGKTPAEFLMGPVTTAHRGTYRCFGSYSNCVWSFPSEPVTLLVTGDAGVANPAPTEQPSSSDTLALATPVFWQEKTDHESRSRYKNQLDSWKPHMLTTKRDFHKDLALWDYTSENLFRMGLAFLVLVALVCLLVEDRISRKKTEEQVNRASGQERRMTFRVLNG